MIFFLYQGNQPENNQGFPVPAEPTKSLEMTEHTSNPRNGVTERWGIRICLPVHCLSVRPDRQPYYHTNATSSPCNLVEERPNCVRQSLANTLSAHRVAATSYCRPGHHANVVTPCLLTLCLNMRNSIEPLKGFHLTPKRSTELHFVPEKVL